MVTMLETLRLALDTLRAHKLRSFLTLLGVILAVTTLVAVMSVVRGSIFTLRTVWRTSARTSTSWPGSELLPARMRG
jgi:ABC-type antimicrobial peptide transport system permease subunit